MQTCPIQVRQQSRFMRTQDPANIRADFDAAIGDIETAINAAEQAIHVDPARKLIAEYSFVSAATLFEGFISDLFVAYINRDSQRFRDHLLYHLNLQSDDEFAKRALPHVEKTMPHLSVEKIRGILDSNGYNVAFPTTDKMKESAGKWLADADKQRFTALTSEQCAVIALLKAIRNFLAHRSDSADIMMQDSLLSADLPANFKRMVNNVSDVGAYLRANQQGQSRLNLYLTYLKTLSAQLCP
jgi:hypothetical protein